MEVAIGKGFARLLFAGAATALIFSPAVLQCDSKKKVDWHGGASPFDFT
jgi:hypothetical protein